MDQASSVAIVFFVIVVVFFALTNYRANQTIKARDDQIADLGAQLGQYKYKYLAMRALAPAVTDTDIDNWIAAWVAAHPLG